jgi:peptidoglycan lytic transglycosylase
MMTFSDFATLTGLLALLCAATGCAPTPPAPSASEAAKPADTPPDAQAAKLYVEELAQLPPIAPRGGIDHSGRKQKGRASYYASHFNNRKMANGNRFDPDSNVAASKTLPLGTTAKVTNLSNGKSATVKVEDRGPYVDGRVVDLTPKVADQLDMKKVGVTPVVVAPIAVPQKDGAIKLGAGAAEASPKEVDQATQETAAAAR